MKCVIPTFEDGTRDWECDLETTNADGVCDSCKRFGWTVDPKEIQQAILNDPDLRGRVDIKSPIQPDESL